VIQPTVCVSIGEVTPASWKRCEQLLQALGDVAPTPVTLLVVPCHHRAGTRVPPWYRTVLTSCLAEGHELAMHGCTFRSGSGARNALAWWLDGLLAPSAPEFAALSETECAARIGRGCVWFWAEGWRVHGFVPPGGVIGAAAWRVLEVSVFRYVATRSAIHLLAPHSGFHLPEARPDSVASIADRPVIRLALHTNDASRPQLLLAAQKRLERLLEDRRALTLAALARCLRRDFTAGRGSSTLWSPAGSPR
jgi:uncharacterized protein